MGQDMEVVSCQLSVVSCQLSVVSCQLSVVSCQLSIVEGSWSRGLHNGQRTTDNGHLFDIHCTMANTVCIIWSTTLIRRAAPWKARCCCMRLIASSSRLTPLRAARWDWRVSWTTFVASAFVFALAAWTETALTMDWYASFKLVPLRAATGLDSRAAIARAVWL